MDNIFQLIHAYNAALTQEDKAEAREKIINELKSNGYTGDDGAKS